MQVCPVTYKDPTDPLSVASPELLELDAFFLFSVFSYLLEYVHLYNKWRAFGQIIKKSPFGFPRIHLVPVQILTNSSCLGHSLTECLCKVVCGNPHDMVLVCVEWRAVLLSSRRHLLSLRAQGQSYWGPCHKVFMILPKISLPLWLDIWEPLSCLCGNCYAL